MMRSLESPEIADTIVVWKPHGVRDHLAFTPANCIGLMEDGCSVLKYPHSPNQDAHMALREEANRYARLSRHDNLVTFRAMNDDGLVLEYCERGALHDMIDALNECQRLCIAAQIARGLTHLHAQNFIHCDLNVRNIFITSEFTAKIGDLQGQLSRPDGTIEMPAMTENNAKSRLPGPNDSLPGPDDIFSAQTDIFALGTLLYHVWYGHPPYPELDEFSDQAEIQLKYRRGEFPINIANAVGIEKVIWQCWISAYANADEMLDDITRLRDSQFE